MSTQSALEKLRDSLSIDEDYFETWKCNIAMAVYDEISKLKKEELTQHILIKACNVGATNFLNNLIEN